MPFYYMVKPEFDQYHVRYCVEDKRTKSGKRTEAIVLFGGELLDKRIWIRIVLDKPIYSDFFKELKVPSFNIYWSFGCRFAINKDFDGEDLDNFRVERLVKSKQFLSIYEKYKKNERDVTFSERILIGCLSLESLNECIKWYSNKLSIKEEK